LAAGLRPDPVGELKRSPTLPSRERGPTSKGGEGRGREGRREMEGREGWEGKREGRRRVGEGGEMGEGGGREREGKGMGKRREGKGPQEKFDKSSTGEGSIFGGSP